jgi:hypothetical protein
MTKEKAKSVKNFLKIMSVHIGDRYDKTTKKFVLTHLKEELNKIVKEK